MNDLKECLKKGQQEKALDTLKIANELAENVEKYVRVRTTFGAVYCGKLHLLSEEDMEFNFVSGFFNSLSSNEATYVIEQASPYNCSDKKSYTRAFQAKHIEQLMTADEVANYILYKHQEEIKCIEALLKGYNEDKRPAFQDLVGSKLITLMSE